MWKVVLILLFLVSCASAQVVIEDGLCDGLTCFVYRNPFYGSLGSTSCSVSIVSPVNGSTYFSNTLNVSVTSSGLVNPVCQYWENGAGPNVFVCGGDSVTFPNGVVTLEVSASDGSCLAADSIVFNVVLMHGRGRSEAVVWPVFLFLGCLIAYSVYRSDV